MVRNNIIQNCSINVSDINNAHDIFVTDLAGVIGKTGRKNTDKKVTDYVWIPHDFLKLHKYVTIIDCVVFVKKL